MSGPHCPHELSGREGLFIQPFGTTAAETHFSASIILEGQMSSVPPNDFLSEMEDVVEADKTSQALAAF